MSFFHQCLSFFHTSFIGNKFIFEVKHYQFFCISKVLLLNQWVIGLKTGAFWWLFLSICLSVIQSLCIEWKYFEYGYKKINSSIILGAMKNILELWNVLCLLIDMLRCIIHRHVACSKRLLVVQTLLVLTPIYFYSENIKLGIKCKEM